MSVHIPTTHIYKTKIQINKKFTNIKPKNMAKTRRNGDFLFFVIDSFENYENQMAPYFIMRLATEDQWPTYIYMKSLHKHKRLNEHKRLNKHERFL